jgi:3-oxoacyl-[acyl-carrier-protein] synthase II
MVSSTRRAVFTCLGLHSAIGSDPDAYWAALLAGTSGIQRIQSLDPTPLHSQIAGEIRDYDPKKFIPSAMKEARKAVGRLARTVQLGVTAAQQAMTAGGPAKGQIDPFRFGIEFACVMVATDIEDIAGGAAPSVVGLPLGEVSFPVWGGQGLKQVPPLWMLKYLPNMPACHASINADAQGPNNTHTATDVAGLSALGEAYRILQRNGADFFLVGGCESKINPLSLSRYDTFAPLTRSHNASPAHAVRPFDRDRDGTALGEAAAVFGLEDLAFAEFRSATILGELTGFACGYDRGKTGSGFARVIRQALQQSGITPADVDHVNAAAGGWVDLDRWEAQAIRESLGDVPVFAPKGHIGNSGAAAGLVELAASVWALRTGQLPGTLNCENQDSSCPVSVHLGPPRAVTKPYAVKLSYTEGGQCAAAVIRKWE